MLWVTHLSLPTISSFQFDHSWLWDSSNMCCSKHFPNSPQWNAELLGKTHYPQKRWSVRFWPRTCQLREGPPAENFRGCCERGQNRKDRLTTSNRIYFQSLAADIFSNIYIYIYHWGWLIFHGPHLYPPPTFYKKQKWKWNRKQKGQKRMIKRIGAVWLCNEIVTF